MPPLDGNGGGAAGAHSHDVVIDFGATSSSSCAVCLEPLEWAAIGPCGHGDVCPGCSLHIRVFRNNRLCCICRSLCRVVVVTKHDAIAAAAAAAAGGGGGGVWPVVSSRLPRSRTGRGYSRFEGRVGEYWYHAGMGAFFDDERQYAAAKAAARLGPPPCGDANENPPPPPPPPPRTRTIVSNSDGQGSLLTISSMTQLDGNRAAGDHRHVVIDVGAAGDGDSHSRSRSCAVCLEPLEWAAIGQCGHGDVCPGCALHIRVFQNNRRCCICRSLCRVVVVTNPDAIAAGGWPAVSSRLPRSRTGGGYSQVEGRVGEYWYHAGMEAFFDDERQYAVAKAAARLCTPPLCGKASEFHRPPQVRGTGASNEQQRSRRDPPDEQRVQLQYVEAVLIVLLVVAAVGLLVGTIYVLG